MSSCSTMFCANHGDNCMFSISFILERKFYCPKRAFATQGADVRNGRSNSRIRRTAEVSSEHAYALGCCGISFVKQNGDGVGRYLFLRCVCYVFE